MRTSAAARFAWLVRTRLAHARLSAALALLSLLASPVAAADLLLFAPAQVDQGGLARVAIHAPTQTLQHVRGYIELADGSRVQTVGFRTSETRDGSRERWQLLFGIPSTAVLGEGRVVVAGVTADGQLSTVERELLIVAGAFAEERIALNAANTSLRTTSDPRRAVESAAMWEVLQGRDVDAVFHLGRLDPPLENLRITSDFGKRRTFVYSDGSEAQSVHWGVDFGAPTGTPVFAPGAGRVVLARDRLITGNTVVLEHLPGVFTLYYHLDELLVSEGADIDRGATIGTVGSTGISTGPHLHWELRIASVPVNPLILVREPFLDIEGVNVAPSNAP